MSHEVIAEHFGTVKKDLEKILNGEEPSSRYGELIENEREYWMGTPIDAFWSPDLPPLDHRMRQAIGRIIASTVIAQAEWYFFNVKEN